MREDGLPWLFSELQNDPQTGLRSYGNFNIDDFGHIVGTALWMWQGWFKPMDPSQPDHIQLPFAIVPLAEGDKLTNIRTGREYKIVNVLHNYRSLRYKPPILPNMKYSVPFLPRVIRKGFHPDELVGGAYQIAPVSGTGIDLDLNMGDFLALGSSKCVDYRQRRAETDDEPGSGYKIQWRITRSEPGYGNEFFTGTTGPKKVRRPSRPAPTDDPTFLAITDGQFFDNLVEFKLKAPNNTELSTLIHWFEAFMARYTGVFQKEGFNRVQYWDRKPVENPDLNPPETGDEELLRWAVRSEKLDISKAPKLRKINVITRLDSEQE